MKVMFVIQGEGRGHLTQALTLKEMLQRNGHEVVDVMVGKSKGREIPAFFRDKINMPITLFSSPNFLPSKDNRTVSLVSSTAYNGLFLFNYMKSIATIRRHVRESGADIVINFYEILCGLTFSLFDMKVPEVCIAHQYIFLHPSYQMPGKHRAQEYCLRQFTRATRMGASRTIALSIRDYPEDSQQRLQVVPPLLRREVKNAVRRHGDYILGYILNPGFYQDVVAWHEAHPKVRLHFFWDKKDAADEVHVDDHLTFHRIDDQKFLTLMAGCKAYATTAGFESVCEALYMGKPCLMVPTHVEQSCNAAEAERELVGVKSDRFDMCRLAAFSREYQEDVEFRMWENMADTRIMATIEAAHDEFYRELRSLFSVGFRRLRSFVPSYR